ncbi:MAG: Na+/H+ antiporter subunit E [Phycisphaerales bacterium]|nr:Na+/H+ antiporter subunit E [Phycisphaerales bacterium]
MNLLVVNLLLAFVWAAMAETFTAGSVVTGFLLGYAALWLLQPVIGRSRYFHRTWAAVRFVVFLAVELVVANVAMVRHVLQPLSTMHPGIVGVPLDTANDLETTLLSICVTLTPGSFAVDVSADGRTLFVHVVDAEDPEAVRRLIKNGYERRLLEVMR